MPVNTPQISVNPYTSTVPTVQVPPQDFSQTAPAQPLPGRFGPGHGTGVMAVGDSILKGFLQGHEYKAQKKTAEANATLAAADSSTNAAYQKYQDALSSASGNVNDPNAQAAYKAYQDVFTKGKEAKAKYVIPQDDEKKKQPKGAKDKIKGMFSNIGEFMQANPHIVPQLALMSMQPNPPGMSPEGKKQAAEQTRVSNEEAMGNIDLQEARRKQNAEKTVDQYSGLSKEQFDALPAVEQEKFRSAQNALNPRTNVGATKLYTLPDGSKGWFHPDNVPEGAQPVEPAAGGASKLGSFADYSARWAKENGIDVSKLTSGQIDSLRKRYAWDTTHDSTSSTTVRPGIDSTTTTSTRSAGGPPPLPSAGGGPITRPPASAPRGARGSGGGGGITAPPGSETNPSPTRARMTMQASHEKESKISQAEQKMTDAKMRNMRIVDPTLKKQADDMAQKAYEEQVKSAEHGYDQATRAVGGKPGTPGGTKKAAAGAPKGASIAYKDKNGVIQGYAVNGQYVPVSQ